MAEAGARAGIPRATLYAWRRDAPRFRAAWDRAAADAEAMHLARWESDLLDRALGTEEQPIGRGRRADRDLMLAVSWFSARRTAAAPAEGPPAPAAPASVARPGERVTRVGNLDVVIAPLGRHGAGAARRPADRATAAQIWDHGAARSAPAPKGDDP